MKKMNKTYILTALGVLGSPLLTISANADTIYMCKACKSGTYAKDNKCETCPAGSYCVDGVKYTCAAGKYSTGGASSCSTCEAGKFSGAGASSCTSCSAGTYSSAGASSCLTCSAGQYSDAGASSCKTCEAGYYCTNGKRTACSDGTYSDAGATSCKTCSTAGKYCSGGREYSCPAGQYCPDGIHNYSCETRYYYGGCSTTANGDKYKHEKYSKTIELRYSLKGSTSTTKIYDAYYSDSSTTRGYWDYFYSYESSSPYKLRDKCSGQPYCLFCDPITGDVTLKKNTNQCK